MLKNSKTSYIVPGYTGHLPKSQMRETEVIPEDPHGQIPGYCGYVSSVKPENIFGQTYGTITYTINCLPYHKGQDVDAQERYSSLTRSTYVNQTEIQQRTAANIVGVTPKPPNYRAPSGDNVSPCKAQEEAAQGGDSLDKEVSKYLSIAQDIPGYTGHARRIAADNLYGVTFANAKRNATQSQGRIDGDRDDNLGMVSSQTPKLGRANH